MATPPIRRARLGLRGKTIIILAVTICLEAISVTVGSRWYFSRSIASLERADAEDAARRAVAIIDDDIDQLDILVRDWASWDDAWNYMEDRSAAFEASNLSDATFSSLGLSSFLLIDAGGMVRFAYGEAGAGIEAMAAEYWSAARDGAGARGVSAVGGMLSIACARPIRRSDGRGETRGVLVMARSLDAARIEKYSRLAGNALSIVIGAGNPSPDGAASATFDPSSRTASMPLRGAGGESVASVVVSLPRSRAVGGGAALATLLVGITLSVALLGMLAAFAFEIAVLRRMRKMGAELSAIASDDENRSYIGAFGRDELATLAVTMNLTLSSLYRTIDEKEVALREIHHRVKNNLQIIQSLIHLQASADPSGSSAAAMREVGRRVGAIAFVHEEVFVIASVERVDCKRLLARIAAAARDGVEGKEGVRVGTRGEELTVSLDQSTSFGLIAGEVLNSAFRRDFPPGGGAIDISIARSGGSGLILAIADDGEGPDLRAAGGLGAALVSALADQLGARCDFSRREGGGSLFTLSLPSDEREPEEAPSGH